MLINRITLALHRARIPLILLTFIYVSSLSAGIIMVTYQTRFALSYRDTLVVKAHRLDPAARANDNGQHLLAATIDFSRNLGLAAVPETIGGLTIVLPIGMAAYRGWVGGIVSVDSSHKSRLRHFDSAIYYVVTIMLQLAAFSLAGGAGLHLGLAFFRRQRPFVGPPWFRLPKEALGDAIALYALIIPLFAIGSAWEFLWPIT